ncbi:JmjC domain, partial [Trinorchestia longiramus]
RWNCIRWSIEEWTKHFGEEQLKVRLGLRTSNSAEPQWESNCQTSYLTFGELSMWDTTELNCTTASGESVSSVSHWAYFDYVHLKEHNGLEFLKSEISWEEFGFKGRGADESTVWIGTKGAHTPCHMDTYGCNLIVQVHGLKKWTLFPPEQTDYLYPTRIPYEESSVYSQIDFTDIDCGKFSAINKSTPFCVTLNPGDVLYVPKHWWHFVETQSFSISINSWIELPSDLHDQLKEAIVMHHVGSISNAIDTTEELTKIFNPNMLHLATLSSEERVDLLVQRIKSVKNTESSSDSKANKQQLMSEESTTKKDAKNACAYVPVNPCSFQEFIEVARPAGSEKSPLLSQTLGTTHGVSSINELLISSLTDPRVIDVTTKVLMEKLR